MTADFKLYILGFRKQINRKQANNIGEWSEVSSSSSSGTLLVCLIAYVGCYSAVSLMLPFTWGRGCVYQNPGKYSSTFLNTHTICQHLPAKRGFNSKQTALLIG